MLNPKRIQKPFRKLGKLLKRMPKEPAPDQVHDLRTHTRAVESMATALSLDSRSGVRKLLKDLARIRRRAGKVRDLDVITGYAATVQANGERDCTVRLLEYLGAERRRKARKLHAAVTKRGRAARDRLKQTATRFEQQLSQNHDPECDEGAPAARAMASAVELGQQLAEPNRLDRRNLHAYRLKVKELRNVLRMAAEANHNQDLVSALGEVKDAIGEWHDFEELLSVSTDVLDHGGQCRLLRELKLICDQKYQNALRKTENMRRRYFHVSRGRSDHRLKAREPLWRATTAIAA